LKGGKTEGGLSCKNRGNDREHGVWEARKDQIGGTSQEVAIERDVGERLNWRVENKVQVYGCEVCRERENAGRTCSRDKGQARTKIGVQRNSEGGENEGEKHRINRRNKGAGTAIKRNKWKGGRKRKRVNLLPGRRVFIGQGVRRGVRG